MGEPVQALAGGRPQYRDQDVSPVATRAASLDGRAARASWQGSGLLVRAGNLSRRCIDRTGEQAVMKLRRPPAPDIESYRAQRLGADFYWECDEEERLR